MPIITHVQSNANFPASGAATVTLTGVKVGNLLVVTCIEVSSNAITNMSDGSNTWRAAATKITNAANITLAMYYTVVTTGGTLNITHSSGTVSFNTLIVSEFSSNTGWVTLAFDKTAGQAAAAPGAGTDKYVSGVTATRTQPAELLVGALATDSVSADNISNGTNWTLPAAANQSNFSFVTGAQAHRIMAGTGTEQALFSDTSNFDYICEISTFMPVQDVFPRWDKFASQGSLIAQ